MGVFGMKKFNNLYIRGTNSQLKEFKNRVLDFPKGEWTFNYITIQDKDYLAFIYNGEILPAATLYIMIEEHKTEWSVDNIVPINKCELTYDEYNDLLDNFYNNVLEKIKIKGIEYIYESDPDYNILDEISINALTYLQAFSNAANKSTGSSHPLDRERWFKFICETVNDNKIIDTNNLTRYLCEDLGWNQDRAFELGCEYEFGVGLLENYKKNCGEDE